MDLLTSILGRSGYLPHGYCFTWSPGLLWPMVGADALIAAAYFSIPLATLRFVRQRGEMPLRWVPWLFSAFILACGVTHVMDIWTIWQPDYALQAAAKVITAAVSIVTAVALWPLIPRALKIPSVEHLAAVIRRLEAEIGRRRSTEDHLREVQQSLAVALATLGAGFIATDRQGRVTRMNAVAEQVLGWTEQEAAGRSLWRVFAREDRPPEHELSNPVDVMVDQGVTADMAHHVVAIGRDGTRTALEVRAGLTRDDDGSVQGLAMLFRDLTPQIRAEAEASRLAAIVDSSSDAIIGKTLDGRITSWNGAATAMFGYDAEEAIGQPVQMLIPPEHEAEEMRILADLARGQRVAPFDTVRRTKDGRSVEVSLSISPIRNARGLIVGAAKIARDISRQRRAEAALRASEAKLRFTLESAQLGDWDLDLLSGTVRRSVRHDRCFGHDTLQDAWTFGTFMSRVHADDRFEVLREFHRATAAQADWQVQCRVIWPDASVHWIAMHGSVRREDGAPARMLGIVSEITQQKLAEAARLTAQRLEAENRQIQESNRLKSLFLANMSHELRTPLNAVIGFADLLQSGAVSPESPKHGIYLGHIGSSGRHLLQLINDVLDLSKVESGRFEFHPEPVELPQLIADAGEVLQTALQRKRIELVTVIAPELTGLVLDPARLKQALYNYLSNAIKFTPEGGRVTVRALPEGAARWRLEVQDNGIGIAEADLSRLFTEFQQLDSSYSKQHQGTGLGLALTRRLVQAQGGSVGVRSTAGVGSVFWLVLDRVQRIDPRPGADAQAPAHRLLVIEDDPDHQTHLVRALSAAGFQVDAAATGEQALHRAQGSAYSAITLDLLLPDQRGLDVLAGIRSRGPSREAPVLGVTMPAEPGAAASFSIADVLAKPIRADEMAVAMARLRARELRRSRVMVIDDDPLALDLMHSTLAAMGIDAAGWLDGREALRALDAYRPDAVVMDLMMPGYNGFAVLDDLRRVPAWCDVPVYIWTSMILTDDEYEALARTARTILGKGGGALAPMLASLRGWRPTTSVRVERYPT
jgi:PAS domain S-box-containing protein